MTQRIAPSRAQAQELVALLNDAAATCRSLETQVPSQDHKRGRRFSWLMTVWIWLQYILQSKEILHA
jgi:hypothetical protein